jgi:hypothetical protein
MLAEEKGQREGQEKGKPKAWQREGEEAGGVGKKGQNRARDLEGSSLEVARIGSQRVSLDEASFHQRER